LHEHNWPHQPVTYVKKFLDPDKCTMKDAGLMKLKLPLFTTLALGSFLSGLVQAQTVSFNAPPTFLTANDSDGETKFTVNQTVTQPPSNLPVSYFSFNSQPFEATTANSTGHTTIWTGRLTIASNGTISGNATVESFTNTGNKTTASVTINSTNSRIGIATSTGALTSVTTVNRMNMRSESYGPYADYYSFDLIADYPADILIRFSNGFTARGKLIESITKSHSINDLFENYGDPSEWSDKRYVLTITGPNGHTGTIIK
jgi:hypothetical protein